MILTYGFFLMTLAWVTATVRLENPVPYGDKIAPFFEIEAQSLYDAGFQQGQLASKRIKKWMQSREMKDMEAFTTKKGKKVFLQLKRENSLVFPQYVEEMRGLARGAGVDLDTIWRANLILELESLMVMLNHTKPQSKETTSTSSPSPTSKNEKIKEIFNVETHCSDFNAISSEGYKGGFSHGHNEDWNEDVKYLWYLVKYKALPGANFKSCAGLAYPGTLIGWVPTWNQEGIYITQNSLFPVRTEESHSKVGLSSVFIQREAVCGLNTKHDNLDDVVATLTSSTYLWDYGAAVNIVDLNNHRMANVETFRKFFSIFEVTENMGNYSHFNRYKHLKPDEIDIREASSIHRQQRADNLPPLRSTTDIKERLSDTYDNDFPIFRKKTLATFILDGISQKMTIWCCGIPAYTDFPPIYTFDLANFF